MCFLVSRIVATGERYNWTMQLDVNTEIYSLHVGEKFMMVLVSTLNLDGTPDSGYYTQVILIFLYFSLLLAFLF